MSAAALICVRLLLRAPLFRVYRVLIEVLIYLVYLLPICITFEVFTVLVNFYVLGFNTHD